MTQLNGLPDNPQYFDEISSHDFARSDEWVVSSSDSTWTLEPPANMAIKITSVSVRFSEKLVMHSGGSFMIKFFMDGTTPPVYTITYANKRDFVKRASEIKVLPMSGDGDVNSSVADFIMDFAKPPVLWSTTGVDALGVPKFNKMTLEIEDDTPYKQEDGVTPAQMAVSRYECEYYSDPVT